MQSAPYGTNDETGRALGFTSLEQETRIDGIPVEGTIPAWLEGSLLRSAPAKWDLEHRSMRHWFDGLAMLHRFSIADGAVSYQNRFLQTREYRAVQETGDIAFSEFATDPCRSLFQRVMAVFSPPLTDNANVNLTVLGGRFIAMTETPIPVLFDPDTLAAAGVAYEVPGQLTTAHPHLDRITHGMLNYAAQLGPRSSYRFFHLAPDAHHPTVIGSAPVREPAYMHSFGLTPRWLVLAEFPLVVNPLDIVRSGRPYIENFRWKPELGTRFRLCERTTGRMIGPFTTDARFGFHHVNAFEEDGDVIADLCTFADAQIVEDLYLERLRAGRPIATPRLERFRISPATGTVTIEPLTEAAIELPRINYQRCNERPYRYVWGNGTRHGWLDEIVKVDVSTGESTSWAQDGCFPSEPVFVAAPGADDEDDGVLLSIVLDAGTERSSLLALDARDLTEVARAEVPHHIPFGFHGQFVRGMVPVPA